MRDFMDQKDQYYAEGKHSSLLIWLKLVKDPIQSLIMI